MIHLCNACRRPCQVTAREVVDWEPYGDREVPRRSVVEETDCCGADFRTIPGDYLCSACGRSARIIRGLIDGEVAPLSACCGQPLERIGSAPTPSDALRGVA